MILVDGSSMLHRMMNTEVALLRTSDGRHQTGGLHGFITSLGNIAKQYHLKRGIVVAWDLGSSRTRRELYPDYKEGRCDIDPSAVLVTSEEDRAKVHNYFWTRKWLHGEILPRMGCLSVLIREIEADDIIAWICRNTPEELKTIVTGDEDLLQLVDECTDWLDPRYDNKYFTKDRLIDEYKLLPDFYIEHFKYIKAIVGDGSDNIRSIGEVAKVKGLGDVNARKISEIILTKGLQALDPENRLHKLVIENQETFNLNYRLIDLYNLGESVDLEIKRSILSGLINDLSSDENKLYDIFETFELRRTKTLIPIIGEANFNSDFKKILLAATSK